MELESSMDALLLPIRKWDSLYYKKCTVKSFFGDYCLIFRGHWWNYVCRFLLFLLIRLLNRLFSSIHCCDTFFSKLHYLLELILLLVLTYNDLLSFLPTKRVHLVNGFCIDTQKCLFIFFLWKVIESEWRQAKRLRLISLLFLHDLSHRFCLNFIYKPEIKWLFSF